MKGAGIHVFCGVLEGADVHLKNRWNSLVSGVRGDGTLVRSVQLRGCSTRGHGMDIVAVGWGAFAQILQTLDE